MSATPPSRGVRVAVLAAIVAALAAGGWFALRPADREPAPASVPASKEATAARAQRAAGLATREKDPAVAPAAPLDAPAAPEPGAEDRVPLAPKDGPIRLTVTLVGEGKTPKVVRLVAHPDGGANHAVRLVLEPPALEGRLPAAATFDFEIAIDGWESDQSVEKATVSDEGAVAIEIRLAAKPALAVVDATSGAPLAGAEAVPMGWYAKEHESLVAPSPFDHFSGGSRRGDAQGRIALPATANPTEWWVRAPGHAWGRARAPLASETTRVPLDTGGAIRAEIEGVTDWEGLLVVAARPLPARSVDGSPLPPPARDGKRRYSELVDDVLFDVRNVPNRFEVHGLPPGAWRVVVGRGRYMAEQTIGEAAVEVIAGQVADVHVVAKPGPALPKFQVDLEISVPEGWREEKVQVNVRGVGGRNEMENHDLSRASADTAVIRARLSLSAGPYAVVVHPLDWVVGFRVRADGETASLSIPPPTRVRVHVLDEEGKRVATGAHVRATYTAPFSPSATSADLDDPPVRFLEGWADLDEDPDGNGFVGRLAAGPIEFTVEAPGRVEAILSDVLAPSDAERVFEIRMPRAGQIEVRAVKDGKLVADADGDIELEPVRTTGDDPDWWRSENFNSGKGRFDGLVAGSYQVGCSPRRGQAKVQKTVTVRVGEVTVVEFEAK